MSLIDQSEVHQVVQVREPCPAGGTHVFSYIDSFRGGKRGIYCEVACTRCNEVSSADLAEMPQEVMRSLLNMHGAWELKITADARRDVLGALRKLLSLPLSEIVSRMQEPLMVGSRAQILELMKTLRDHGVRQDQLLVRKLNPA